MNEEMLIGYVIPGSAEASDICYSSDKTNKQLKQRDFPLHVWFKKHDRVPECKHVANK